MRWPSHNYPAAHRAGLSRQAHSYAKDSPPRSSSRDAPQQDFKHAAGSGGRRNKVSCHLFPLISKFEALDALSQEIQEPSLWPAPLHTSRTSTMPRGGFDGPTSMKLEAIFSPRKLSGSSRKEALLQNLIASPSEDVFTSGTLKRGSGKLKPSQLPDNFEANNIRLSSGTNKVSDPKEFKNRIPSYTGNTRAIRLRGDIHNLSSPKENELKSRMSSYTRNTKAKVKEQRGNGTVKERIKYFDGNMERSSPSSSCGCIQTSNSTHGSLFSATTASNGVANLPALQHIAPTAPTSPNLSLINRYMPAPRSTRVSNSTITKRCTPQTPTKSQIVKSTKRRRQMQMDAPSPFSQKADIIPPVRPISPAIASTGQKADKIWSFYRPLYRTRKVLDPLGKDLSPEEKGCQWRLAEPVARRVSSMIKGKQTNKSLETVQHARISDTPNGATSDRRNAKDSDIKLLRERSVVAKSFQSGPRSPPTKAICGSIQNRIKEWDSRAEVKGRPEEAANGVRCYKPMGNSIAFRRSIYKNPWNDEVGRELHIGGFDGPEVQAVMDEIQDIGGELENDDAVKGQWKMVVAPRLDNGGLTGQSDIDIHGSRNIDMRIIVREAQCGLAEPKPLRLREMKMMILLCRECAKV